MATHSRRIRAQDLPDVPVPDSILGYELVGGELLPVTPAHPAHSRLILFVFGRFMEYEKAHRTGKAFSDAWFNLRLVRDPEQTRAPDVSFVFNDKLRMLGGRLPTVFPFPPDVALEVFSPSNERKTKDWNQRLRDLLDAGTPVLWVIYPDARYAVAFRPDGSARMLREHETLSAEAVLPGLAISLSEIFADLDEPLP
ncbi:MAG: Uma2 family endonuclease [Gemmatimonadota bacterium]